MNDVKVTSLPSEQGQIHKQYGLDWYCWVNPLIGKPLSGLVIGAGNGEVPEWFLEHVFTHPEARLWSLDTFDGTEQQRLAGVDCSELRNEIRTRLERFGHRSQLYREESHTALKTFFREFIFEFIYLGGAKDSMSVLRDSVLAFEMLSTGGVIIWSDYEWDTMPDDLDRPKMAIEAFLQSYGPRFEVIGLGKGEGAQVAVRKIR